MGRRSCRSSLQGDVAVGSFENGVEINRVAMYKPRGFYAVLEEEVDFLQVLQRAASLKVEDEAVRRLAEASDR